VKITPAMKNVLDLLYTGMNQEEIAQKLGISAGTVKVYSHLIYQANGVQSRVELMAKKIEDLRDDY
jgi:two-component system, NarL family, nitrate/nitrite response regulator NarL